METPPPPAMAPSAPRMAPAPENRSPRPRPRASTSLLVLATLAVGFTLWAAQGLILPVLLAMFFALIGNPIIRLLRRAHVPRFVAALLLVLAGVAGTVMLGQQLIGPAAEWVREAPRSLRELAPALREVTRPVKEANEAAERLATAAGGETDVQVVRTETRDPLKLLLSAPKLITAVLAVVLLTFFFMVYGANLQRHALALLPTRQQQRLTTEILSTIELEISRYVLTISVINVVVGGIIAGLLYWIGVPIGEALLWGTIAALLNFAPYVGPLIGILLLLLMGLVTFDGWEALLPAGIYLVVHTLEGQLITPIVLGRSMRLSPLVLVLALLVFGWAWGIIGLLLAVPLLVCIKLVLSRIDGFEGWARLLE